MELRDIIARNLAELRKAQKYTQSELADKMNYSDKAVSKWENGYAVPNIETLHELGELYGVTVDYILTEHDAKEFPLLPEVALSQEDRKKKTNRVIFALLSILCVFVVASALYICFDIFLKMNIWIVYIWSLPTSGILAIIFNEIWGKRHYRLYFVSFLIWSLLTGLYLQFLEYNIWITFIIGLPLEACLVLWDRLETKNK